jgi:small subunit ribosomal protein S17
MVGTVISNKMDKTVVVVVERLGRHPLYKKVVKTRKRFKAHDADNACQIGDVVRLVESRPLSKEKHWAVEDILRSQAERAEQ